MYKNSSMKDEQIDLGHKRVCPLCAAKYYDFHKDELECPSCGNVLNLKKNDRSKKAYAIKIDKIKKDMQQIF